MLVYIIGVGGGEGGGRVDTFRLNICSYVGKYERRTAGYDVSYYKVSESFGREVTILCVRCTKMMYALQARTIHFGKTMYINLHLCAPATAVK